MQSSLSLPTASCCCYRQCISNVKHFQWALRNQILTAKTADFSSSKSIRFMEMASTLLNADPATKPHATTTSATFTINCVSPPIDLLSLPTTTESFAAVYAQFGVADVVNELLKGIETLLNDQSRPVVSAPEAASGGKNAVVQEEEEEAFSLFGEPARSEEEDDSEDDEDDQHGLSQTQAVRIFFYFLKKKKRERKRTAIKLIVHRHVSCMLPPEYSALSRTLLCSHQMPSRHGLPWAMASVASSSPTRKVIVQNQVLQLEFFLIL